MTVHAKRNQASESDATNLSSSTTASVGATEKAKEKEEDTMPKSENKMAINGDEAEEDESEVKIATIADLSDEELLRLAPEFESNEEAIESLKSIRDVQRKHDEVFEEYVKAKNELEERFEKRFAPLFEERRVEIQRGKLPGFWARCVENCNILSSNITEKDAIALHYLEDLWCDTVTSDKPSADGLNPGSYVLNFRFRDNPFFTNQTLTKTYAMGKDSYDDFPEARGCDIFWKPGKNLTLKTFKKKNKSGKTIVKHEPADSFFNFFNPPDGLGAEDDLASDIENVVEADVELGEAIRNDFIPRALYYFLDMEEDEEEDEEDSEDEEDDEEIDLQPSAKAKTTL